LIPTSGFANVESVAASDSGRETVTYVSNIYKYYVSYNVVMAQAAERRRAANDYKCIPAAVCLYTPKNQLKRESTSSVQNVHLPSATSSHAPPVGRVRCALMLWVLAGSGSTATAQSTGQVWRNLTVDWLASERLVYTLDVEPKVQVTAVTTRSRFANVEVWPSVELAVSG